MAFEAICKDFYGHVEKVPVDETYVDIFEYDDVEEWCRYEVKSKDFDINRFDIINYNGMVENASRAVLEM